MDHWAERFHDYYERGSRLEKEFLLTRALIRAARRWTTYADELVRKQTGFGRAKWQTLSALSFGDGPVATLELSRRMAIQWPSLIRTLGELEFAGLVTREIDPADRRSRLVSITPRGSELLAEVRNILNPARAEIFAEFSDKELVETQHSLGRLFYLLGDSDEHD